MLRINDKPIEHFWTVGNVHTVAPYGSGHINNTFLVKADNGRFILQRINKNVFNTQALVGNYNIHVPSVFHYQYTQHRKITPTILQTRQKKYHHIDKGNFAWRLAEYLPDAKSFDISPNPEISFSVARAFAGYQLFLNTLGIDSMQETIFGFHDLADRFKKFRNIIKAANPKLILKANREIKQVLSFSSIIEETVKYYIKSPDRITHNDTKLNNVIFSGNSSFVIDLDTVMPGKLMLDFGDMVRSFTSPVGEDEPDIEKTRMRTDHFMAIVEGYFGVLKRETSEIERNSLIPGAKYIIYEQSIRFLSDFLQGNIYYKTSFPEHNLVRACTQLKLLHSLIEQETDLAKMIRHIL